jgi:hypothetical protein
MTVLNLKILAESHQSPSTIELDSLHLPDLIELLPIQRLDVLLQDIVGSTAATAVNYEDGTLNDDLSV